MSKTLKTTNREFMLAAVSDELRSDREIVFEVVKRHHPFALNYTSKELQNDPEILKIIANK